MITRTWVLARSQEEADAWAASEGVTNHKHLAAPRHATGGRFTADTRVVLVGLWWEGGHGDNVLREILDMRRTFAQDNRCKFELAR